MNQKKKKSDARRKLVVQFVQGHMDKTDYWKNVLWTYEPKLECFNLNGKYFVW